MPSPPSTIGQSSKPSPSPSQTIGDSPNANTNSTIYTDIEITQIWKTNDITATTHISPASEKCVTTEDKSLMGIMISKMGPLYYKISKQ